MSEPSRDADVDALVASSAPLGTFDQSRAREFLDVTVARGEAVDALAALCREARDERDEYAAMFDIVKETERAALATAGRALLDALFRNRNWNAGAMLSEIGAGAPSPWTVPGAPSPWTVPEANALYAALASAAALTRWVAPK